MDKREYIEKIEIYEGGVKRLRELEKELNSLDTHKFKRYADAIRKNLKSVSRIPELEEAIRELKLRIAGIDVDSEKALIDLRQDKQIAKISSEQKNLESLKLNNPRFSFLENRAKFLVNALGEKGEQIGVNTSQIGNLKNNVSNIKTKLGKTQKQTDQEKEEIKKLNERVAYLKKVIEQKTEELNHKIIHRKNPINRKKLFAQIRSMSSEMVALKEKSESIAEQQEQAIAALREEENNYRQEVEPKINSVLPLDRKVNIFSKLLGQKGEQIGVNTGDIDKLKKKTSKINLLSKILNEKSDELAEEENDLERLRIRIGNLQSNLNFKMDDLEKHLNKRDVKSFINKRKIEKEIEDLRQKIDQSRLELSGQVEKENSDSKSLIEKEKDEIKKAILEEISKVKNNFQQDNTHLSEEVIEKINNLDKKSSSSNDEMYANLLNKLGQIKSELNAVKRDLHEKNQEKIIPKKEEKIIIKESSQKPIEIKKASAHMKNVAPLPKFPFFDSKNSEALSRMILKQSIYDLPTPSFPEMPKLDVPLAAVKKQEVKIIEPAFKKSKRIPKTKYLILEKFENIHQDFEGVRFRADSLDEAVKKGVVPKTPDQDLLSKTLAESQIALESILKIKRGILTSLRV